jgi:integrase
MSTSCARRRRRREKIEILNEEEVATALYTVKAHDLNSIASTALATGMRRGELLAVRWGNCDIDGANMRVERSLEETKAGLNSSPPSPSAVAARFHCRPVLYCAARTRRKHLELRLALRLGRAEPDALVFCHTDGSPTSPDNLSQDWGRA